MTTGDVRPTVIGTTTAPARRCVRCGILMTATLWWLSHEGPLCDACFRHDELHAYHEEHERLHQELERRHGGTK